MGEQTQSLCDFSTYCKNITFDCFATNCIPNLFIILGIVLFILSIIPYLIRQKLISSQKPIIRLWGENRSSWYPILIACVIILLSTFNCTESFPNGSLIPKLIWTTSLFTTLLLIIIACINAKKILCKNKSYLYDAYNHYIQLIILFSVGIAIISIVCLFNIKDKENFIPFSIFAALLSWIFHDTIQGVVAYFHLRSNGLLHIGDWIQIPESNIDGVISDFSLVTVTIKNWDTTTSNIAIYKLQTNSFKNNQEMLDGKTDGRRMYRSFFIDSRSISTFNKDQINCLEEKLNQLGEDTIFLQQAKQSNNKTLNLNLFRLYLRNWLANHREISLTPRLLVRILEPTSEGIPVQIYTYIKKVNLYQYELIQSEITEHTLLAMGWFNLKLYQKPTSKGNSDIVNIENNKRFNNEKN